MRFKQDVEAMVMAVLERGESHGYALIKTLQEDSHGLFNMRENKLYPLLHEMEGRGWIAAAWETPSQGPARRVYRLLPEGTTELDGRRRDWTAFKKSVNAVLKTEGLKVDDVKAH